MLPDQVSNPGPLTYESGALQTHIIFQMLSYCVARVILVAKIENWWLTLIQHLLIISAYYLWFALEMV